MTSKRTAKPTPCSLRRSAGHRRVDERERSPPSPAPTSADRAAHVYPTVRTASGRISEQDLPRQVAKQRTIDRSQC
ncbi:MAG: hypothetical protein EOM26_13860 [Alphaproteobacteria bacterium]|nr:hypothetical protein [Alphaproteobacteria bacterium]